eukprot:Tbor_TRINITY_DN6184_c0_g1::TRINITY_DN6184_c0_g1_i1::g.22180::m.22180
MGVFRPGLLLLVLQLSLVCVYVNGDAPAGSTPPAGTKVVSSGVAPGPGGGGSEAAVPGNPGNSGGGGAQEPSPTGKPPVGSPTIVREPKARAPESASAVSSTIPAVLISSVVFLYLSRMGH